VRVAVRRLDGVESVEVSLDRASADIRLRPSNRVTLAQLRRLVRNNGFSAKDATVTVVGTIVERGGKPALAVTGIDAVWLLRPAAASGDAAYLSAVQRLEARNPALLEATGIVTAPANSNHPEELAIESLKPVAK
jgi:hypothetical protein